VARPLRQQRRRRDARQLAAVAGEVRLVGVAGGRGDERELLAPARGGERALEAQHPREALGAVADRTADAAAQLALADEQPSRELADRQGVAAQARDGRLDERVGGAAGRGAWRERGEQVAGAVAAVLQAAPGRMRTPTTCVPAGSATTKAVVLAPTTTAPAPSVQTMSMQPSGTTRSGAPPPSQRSHVQATQGASARGAGCSRYSMRTR